MNSITKRWRKLLPHLICLSNAIPFKRVAGPAYRHRRSTRPLDWRLMGIESPDEFVDEVMYTTAPPAGRRVPICAAAEILTAAMQSRQGQMVECNRQRQVTFANLRYVNIDAGKPPKNFNKALVWNGGLPLRLALCNRLVWVSLLKRPQIQVLFAAGRSLKLSDF